MCSFLLDLSLVLSAPCFVAAPSLLGYIPLYAPSSLARLASGVKSFAIAIVHSFVKIFLVLFSTPEIESITLLAASRSFS